MVFVIQFIEAFKDYTCQTLSVKSQNLLMQGRSHWEGGEEGRWAILNGGPSEKFLIVNHPKEDHNKQEVKR